MGMTTVRRMQVGTAVLWLLVIVFAWVAVTEAGAAGVAAPTTVHSALPVGPNQTYAVPYFAWNGRPRTAVVVLPRDYLPGVSTEALPCIVEARGRNYAPASHARHWSDLPTREGFIVICADSSGRRELYNSWGVAGQIDDLAELPSVVEQSIPWVRIDRRRLYVVGPSMGGTETLMALALHPEVFAAGISVDGVADLAARYREFLLVDRANDRKLMRREVGGTPSSQPFRYAARSPKTYVRTFAFSRTPFAIWWSAADKLVINQATTQTGRLYQRIKALVPDAPVVQRIGDVPHSGMLFGDPQAAVDYLKPGGVWRVLPEAAPAVWEFREWRPSSGAWGYRITAPASLTRFYRLRVDGKTLTVDSPVSLQVAVPYRDDLPTPAAVVLNGVTMSLVPQDGVLRLTFPAGHSTAVIDP
jgi:poly(3-hydroxybutyrate) depolymerase